MPQSAGNTSLAPSSDQVHPSETSTTASFQNVLLGLQMKSPVLFSQIPQDGTRFKDHKIIAASIDNCRDAAIGIVEVPCRLLFILIQINVGDFMGTSASSRKITGFSRSSSMPYRDGCLVSSSLQNSNRVVHVQVTKSFLGIHTDGIGASVVSRHQRSSS